MSRMRVMGMAFVLGLGVAGCAAEKVDRWAANSTALAKEQTTILLDDNAEQTESLTAQHKLMSPEVEAAIEDAIAPYRVENTRLRDEVASMHSELGKMSESLGDKLRGITNGALGVLGIGGMGAAGAVGRMTKKPSVPT